MKIFNILAILTICTYFDNAHGAFRRFTPKLAKSSNFFSQYAARFTPKFYKFKPKNLAFLGISFVSPLIFFKIYKKHNDIKLLNSDNYAILWENYNQKTMTKSFKKQILKEELDEFIEFFNKPLAGIDNNQKSRYFIPLSDYNLFTKTPLLQAKLKDIKQTFDKLKILMKLPNDLDIVFCTNQSLKPSTKMYYSDKIKTITILPMTILKNNSQILKTLIHEARHCQQYNYEIKFYNKSEYEKDAETYSINSINCSTCLKKINCFVKNKELFTEKGYLTQNGIKYFANCKKGFNLCDAHKPSFKTVPTFIKNTPTCIKMLLQRTSYNEFLKCLDSGTIEDRLSTVKVDGQKI